MSSITIPQVPKDTGFLPRQTKILLGAFLVLAAIGGYALFNLQDTQQYFLTLAELKDKGDLAYKQSVRVGGNLMPDSTQIDTKQVAARFTMTDGNIKMPVAYSGILPDTFEKSTQVIAEGKLGQDGVFHATLVLAKCPSKYDPSQIEWHSSTDPGNLNYSSGK